MNISKLLKKYKYTSSPYIFYDDGAPSMYFTILEGEKWQLYFTNNKEVRKVNLPQIDDSITQMTCYTTINDQGIKYYCISYCCKNIEDDLCSLWYTETQDPTDFKIVTKIKNNCRGGFITNRFVAFINDLNEICIYNRTNNILENLESQPIPVDKRLYFKWQNPTKLTFLTGNDQQFIVSYINQNLIRQYGVIYFNINQIEQQKIITQENDMPLYNLTIDPFTHQILYGQRQGYQLSKEKIAKTFLNKINSYPTKAIGNN